MMRTCMCVHYDHLVDLRIKMECILMICASFSAGVQCAAVSVVCELARKNPKNYLSLAPTFFKLMTSSTNNWMLIKIIKLVMPNLSNLFPSSFAVLDVLIIGMFVSTSYPSSLLYRSVCVCVYLYVSHYVTLFLPISPAVWRSHSIGA